METLETVMLAIDNVFDTKRKRHIVGGILLSASLFFAGLAITAMTIREEEEYE